jgi:hypothetical protein
MQEDRERRKVQEEVQPGMLKPAGSSAVQLGSSDSNSKMDAWDGEYLEPEM